MKITGIETIVNMFSTNRIVAIWNGLPDYVVDVDSINISKNCLDKPGCAQDIMDLN